MFNSSTGVYTSPREAVDLSQHSGKTLPQFLLSIASSHNRPALIDSRTGETIHSSELRSRCNAIANGLHQLGVRQGDVVMLLAPNSIEYPVVVLSVMSLGATITTVNPVSTPGEVEKQARDSKTKLVVTVASLFHKVNRLCLPVVLMGDALDVGERPNEQVVTTKYLMAVNDSTGLLVDVHVDDNDAAALLYSSGTTGMSKGVILSHRNMVSAAVIHNATNPPPLPREVYLCVIPMFHVYGFVVIVCAQLSRGVPIVVMSHFDFEDMLVTIQRYRVTHAPLVPPVVTALSKSPLVDNYDLSSLVQIGTGAAPLGKEVMDACLRRCPSAYIRQGYGLTESSAIGAVTLPADSKNYGSVGVLVSNTQAKIIDPETGRPQSPRKKGEIWLRSPTIMQGYLNDPKATAETVDKDGWLHTGDLGYIDEAGNVYVVDRIKELIKYKGFQVAPAELEALLLSHPEVLDAAVIPLSDDVAGQIPVAAIVRRPGSSVDEEAIKRFVADQVAPYKKIRKVMFLPAIPKLASGKILRRELVSRLASRL